MKPIVALIGRPNVGKSTFFNRVTKTKDALVDDIPGVTRDRLYRDAKWDGTQFTLVDTGGFLESDDDIFAKHIRFQIEQAIDHADAIVLMLDGKNGISPYDRDLIELLRNRKKPVLYAVNKIDGYEQEDRIYDFYGLGIEKLYPVSAEHGYGMNDFLDELINVLPVSSAGNEEEFIRIAVVGKPNAGKSSLINRILGKERHVVSDMPGTTRDAVDSFVKVNGKTYCLIDTAGIRKKSRVKGRLEKFSIIKALKSLDRCHVALIVIDAKAGITDQDISIAGYAYDRGCGAIFLLNKWDLIEKNSKTAQKFHENLKEQAKFLSFAPVITISALTGQRVGKIFQKVEEVYSQYSLRTGTGQLNRIIERAVAQNEPPFHRGKRLKFYYATQVATKPPSFVCFVNYPDAVHFSYKRYLINRIREETGLDKTPLRLFMRQRTGKIDFSKRKRKR